MNTVRKERGSALILVMIMTVIIMGMIIAVHTLTQDAAEKSETRKINIEALESAEVGLAKSMIDLAGTVTDTGSELQGPIENNSSYEKLNYHTWQRKGSANGVNYTVQVKSAYLAHHADNPSPEASGYLANITTTDRNDQDKEAFDVYEITVASDGVGQHQFRQGVQATVEVNKQTLAQIIPAPLYIHNDPAPDFKGNAFTVSGEDHSLNEGEGEKDYSIKMPCNGKLKITYKGSSAGLVSGFFMIDPETGEEVEIFPSNLPGDQYETIETVYKKGQELQFFARTYGSAWGIGDYDHYAAADGDPYSGKSWAKEAVLETDAAGNTTKMTMSIEDLPGKYWKDNKWNSPDWDYNDIVVEVEVIPENPCATCGGAGVIKTTCGFCGGTGIKGNKACGKCGGLGYTVSDCPDCDSVADAGDDAEAGDGPSTGLGQLNEDNWITSNPGVDAIAYNGSSTVEEDYARLGITKNQEDQLRSNDDGSTTQFGIDSFTHSTIDLRQMAADFIGGTKDNIQATKDGVTEYTKIGNGQNHNYIGSSDDFKVTYINGDAGTLAGQVEGGGVLVINGDAHISGKWNFSGLVIVLGDLKITGGGNDLHILGSILVEGEVQCTGNADIWWCKEAIDKVQKECGYPTKITAENKVWRAIDKAEIEDKGM